MDRVFAQTMLIGLRQTAENIVDYAVCICLYLTASRDLSLQVV